MDLLQAVVLGVIQGLTEFIPVSSSGHLVVVPWLFGWNDPGLAFSVALHLGTLVALLAYFWADWVWLVRGWLRSIDLVALHPEGWPGGPHPATLQGGGREDPPGHPSGWRDRVRNLDQDSRLAWLIGVATVPGVIAGALLEHRVEEWFHASAGPDRVRGVVLIAGAMIALGIALAIAEGVGWKRRALKQVGLVDAILIGVAQAVAIVPGVSRSGSTITMGLFRGFQRDTAARFSFLLATPIVAGAGIKEGFDVLRAGIPTGERLPFAVGIVTAAVVGYGCIAWLLWYLRSRSTGPFILYRIILGAAVIAVALLRT